MRVLSIVGTRPEIIKNLAFCRAAERLGIDFRIAHSAQNFGQETADCFFEDLKIPLVEKADKVDRATFGSIAMSLMDFATMAIERHEPDVVLSNTDTDTAFFTALVAARRRVPVAHIEGGIRCEARLNPEEINRRLADHVSDWVFTISDDDTESLAGEGYPRESIFMLGDITLDALKIILETHKIPVVRGDYDLLTIHRQENANDPKRLRSILDAVESSGFPTVFPIHPRTRQNLEKHGLMDRLSTSRNIKVLGPQPYIKMLETLAGCRKVISDSGGLRREAYMVGKPVISLVSFVWFRKMNELGFELSADADGAKIARAIREYEPQGKRPPLFGDGRAADKILEKLRQELQLRSATGRKAA